ncbi:phosphoglycerate dehydrogenase [Pararhizobium sp.]|uniref:phosphoglycerate dehydrogenase n=1 Tax=Pararhizobium sp. TaxID=1977563 RepID=UPI0027233E83|nr:phosphoglycerate dehydrogenase [Pararhizobium sp.]MDO9416754.1 phosphoglycerate dehydrogenase [Pararhizobium sp.]
MKHRVLVTPRSLTERPHPAIEAMRGYGVDVVYSSAGQQPGEAELLRLVPDITGWLAGVETISPAVVAAAGQLKVISRNGTGIDNLPLIDMRSRGITVRTADGANAQGVAELAIALLFSALRHVPYTDAGLKAGKWPRKRGLELRDRTLGIVGCGAIGREVARLASALGSYVLAYDPARPEFAADTSRFRWVSLEELFAQSDIITLHCPSPRDGRPLVDAAVLASVRPGLILINTARPSLIDGTALVQALDSGVVQTYCVDVFDPEPPVHPGIASRADVIATSHIGGYTEESVNRATEIAVANLMETLQLSRQTLEA